MLDRTPHTKPPAKPFACEWVHPALICDRCEDGTVWASRYGGNDPDVWRAGQCEHCDGDGRVICAAKFCGNSAIHIDDNGEAFCAAHFDPAAE